MKTEELIRALVADVQGPVTATSKTVAVSIVTGAALALVLFLITLHPRHDLAIAFGTPAFVFKLSLAAILGLSACSLLPHVARPTGLPRAPLILLLSPVLLCMGVLIELSTQPAASWSSRLIGHNAAHCLSIIPFLSVAPAVAIVLALRRAAPALPAVAGAVAGLASGAIGAFLYGLTCPDDSPLFVATWYSIAILVVTGLTAAAGSRLLRW